MYAFCATARALQWISTVALFIPIYHYADDHSQIEAKGSSRNGGRSLQAMLDLIGWMYQVEGDKAKDFSQSFLCHRCHVGDVSRHSPHQQ